MGFHCVLSHATAVRQTAQHRCAAGGVGHGGTAAERSLEPIRLRLGGGPRWSRYTAAHPPWMQVRLASAPHVDWAFRLVPSLTRNERHCSGPVPVVVHGTECVGRQYRQPQDRRRP